MKKRFIILALVVGLGMGTLGLMGEEALAFRMDRGSIYPENPCIKEFLDQELEDGRISSQEAKEYLIKIKKAEKKGICSGINWKRRPITSCPRQGMKEDCQELRMGPRKERGLGHHKNGRRHSNRRGARIGR